MRSSVAIAALVLLAACASAPPAPSAQDSSRIDFHSVPTEYGKSIDYSRAPPAEWPTLEIVVYDVSLEEISKVCPLAPDRLRACAHAYFCERRCIIYLPELRGELRRRTLEYMRANDIALPPDELAARLNRLEKEVRGQIFDHEQAHCLGYDHPGSSLMRDAWERAKVSGCGPDMPSRSF